MWGLILVGVKWLLGLWLKQPAAAPQEAVQAKTAGGDEVALAVEKKSNDTVAQARAASDASDRAAVADPAELRAPDPDSRD